MHFILLILKIVGIVLAVILGILLLAAGLFLFAPVRYQADLKKNEEDRLFARAGVSYLFPLLQIKAVYQEASFWYQVRLLGYLLYGTGKQKKEKKKKKSRMPQEKKRRHSPEDNVLTAQEIKRDEKPHSTESKIPIEAEHPTESKIPMKQGRERAAEEKAGKAGGWLQGIWEKIICFWEKIKAAFETVKKLLKDTGRRKDLLFAFLEMQENRQGLQKIISSGGGVLKHIFPQKIRGRIHFGTGDPCSTGQVLGVLGAFYGHFCRNLVIEPEFLEAVLEGELFIKGRIRLFTLLRICITLLRDSNFKVLKRNFEQLKEEL